MSPTVAARLAEWERLTLVEWGVSPDDPAVLSALRGSLMWKRAELAFTVADIRNALRDSRPRWFWRRIIKEWP